MRRPWLLFAATLALTSNPATLFARDWFSYCVDSRGEQSRLEGNSRYFLEPHHHRNLGSGVETVSVTFETARRLKSLVATCTSGTEPVCALSTGEDPRQPGQASGRWRYSFGGSAHSGAEYCVHAFVVR